MGLIRSVPLMGIVLIVYNMINLGYFGARGAVWKTRQLEFTLPSGELIGLNFSEIFIAIALIVLFVELTKASTASTSAMTEQTFSTISFVGFLVQFLVDPYAATPTFFILLMISLIDVLAGAILLVKIARRDLLFGQ